MLEARQIEKTKTDIATTDYFFVVQGNAFTDVEYLRQTTSGLIDLLHTFCGGQAHFLYAPWRQPNSNH
jgi:hypothetical protein